jgi:hypothetical protein
MAALMVAAFVAADQRIEQNQLGIDVRHSAKDVDMLFGGFQSGTPFTHALGLITDVVIDPQSVTNITVAPYAPNIIGDRP